MADKSQTHSVDFYHLDANKTQRIDSDFDKEIRGLLGNE